MFVPRAVRLKGVKETQKRGPNQPAGSDATKGPSDDALVQAMQNASTNSAAPSPAAELGEAIGKTKNMKKPKTSTAAPSSEYLAQLVAGIELIFTDYAHQDEAGAKWLAEHYRSADSEENYIHLTAILSHPNIATLKPQATQPLLRQALQDHPSPTLDLSPSGSHVRRRPSTYPAPFVPSNSFSLTNDDGLSFWDQRTIYVEPHIRHLCKTPAKVAHWLKEHGQLKAKWLPVQAVHTLYNGCAFVVLSGNVMLEDQWAKWRATGKPADWKVMTKVENLRRTEEYEALLRDSRKEAARQRRMSEDGGVDGGKKWARVRDRDRHGGERGAVDDGEKDVSVWKKRKWSKSSAGVADAGPDEDAAPGDIEGHVVKRRA